MLLKKRVFFSCTVISGITALLKFHAMSALFYVIISRIIAPASDILKVIVKSPKCLDTARFFRSSKGHHLRIVAKQFSVKMIVSVFIVDQKRHLLSFLTFF